MAHVKGPINGQFHQHFMQSFYAPRSQKRKNSFKLSIFLQFWDLHMRKSFAENVDEIDPKLAQNFLKKADFGTENSFRLGTNPIREIKT